MRSTAFILIALVAGCDRTPPEPEPKAARRPVQNLRPSAPERPAPTLDDRIAEVERIEKSNPTAYRTAHRAWKELLKEAAGTPQERIVRDALERLEVAAHLDYRKAYRATYEAVAELVAAKRVREARERLLAWNVPEELDIDGSRARDVAAQRLSLERLIDYQAARAKLETDGDDADLDRALEPYLRSPDLLVRVESERGLVELRRRREIQRRRREGIVGFAGPLLRETAMEEKLKSVRPSGIEKACEELRRLARGFPGRSLDEFLAISREGRKRLDAALQAAAWYPVLHYARAEWRYSVEADVIGALEDLGEAVRRQPDFVEARLARARLALEAGLHQVALDELKVLTRGLVGDLRAALKEAREEAEKKNFVQARAAIDRACARLTREVSFAAGKKEFPPNDPQWKESVTVESERYVLRAEGPVERDRIERAARELEAARDRFEELLPGVAARPGKVPVFIFANEDSYADFGDDPLRPSIGRFQPAPWRILLHRRRGAVPMDVLIHETFHEYARHGDLELPTWVDEGLADEAGDPSGRPYLEALKAAFREGWAGVPFGTILRESQDDFYGAVRFLQYAQAWSMVHFLREGKYKDLFARYLSALVAGASAKKAYERTFAGEELSAMQREWRESVGATK